LEYRADGESIDHDIAEATPLVRKRFEMLGARG
jgi:hypothetical protein